MIRSPAGTQAFRFPGGTGGRARVPGVTHLLGDGGDEGGRAGRGDERQRVPRRARRVGRRAQGQPHCDAKRAPDKAAERKGALEIWSEKIRNSL